MNREGQIVEQRRYILSTCGTSLLTNDSGDLRSLLNRYANYHSAKDIPEEDRKRIEQHLAVRHAAVQSTSLDEMRKLSAEINSLLRLYPEGLHGKGDTHTLLCTDTWLGENAASLVEAWLTQHGLNATVY